LGKRFAPGKAAGVTPGKVKADLLVFIPVLVNHEEHEAPFGLHEAVKTTYTDNLGSRGFIPWPPEAFLVPALTTQGNE